MNVIHLTELVYFPLSNKSWLGLQKFARGPENILG